MMAAAAAIIAVGRTGTSCAATDGSGGPRTTKIKKERMSGLRAGVPLGQYYSSDEDNQ